MGYFNELVYHSFGFNYVECIIDEFNVWKTLLTYFFCPSFCIWVIFFLFIILIFDWFTDSVDYFKVFIVSTFVNTTSISNLCTRPQLSFSKHISNLVSMITNKFWFWFKVLIVIKLVCRTSALGDALRGTVMFCQYIGN